MRISFFLIILSFLLNAFKEQYLTTFVIAPPEISYFSAISSKRTVGSKLVKVENAFFHSPHLILPPHWTTLSPSLPPLLEPESVQEKEEELPKEHTLPDFSISNQPFVNYVSLLRRISIR
jgi:hypothetical protein